MAQRSETVRQTRSCYTYLVQRCNPTAAHKPTAAEGNTISVRRHIRGVSELTIRHRGWAELGGLAHNIPRLHRTNHHQPPRKKLTFSAVVFLCQLLLCWRQQRVNQ